MCSATLPDAPTTCAAAAPLDLAAPPPEMELDEDALELVPERGACDWQKLSPAVALRLECASVVSSQWL